MVTMRHSDRHLLNKKNSYGLNFFKTALGGGTLPCPINEPNCDRTNNGGDTSSALQMVPGMLGTLSLFLGVCALW